MNRPQIKHKSRPEDFRVEELSALLPQGGPYALYLLTKRGLGTPEAIDAILQRWKLRRGDISFGGLKDRHAVTAQWITIHGGPRRHLAQTNFELSYRGQVGRPFTPKDIRGNAFAIVLRNLGPEDIETARVALPLVVRDGLPNYFDEQRFGSVGESGDFIARAWCAEDYQRALWLAVAEPNVHDRPQDREEKEIFQQHWGDWRSCLKRLEARRWGSLLGHLIERPMDFRGAMPRLPAEQRGLYLAAFQSYLWNRMLAELLRRRVRPEQQVDLRLGHAALVFFRELDGDQRQAIREIELPLPSSRIRSETEPWREIIDQVLEPTGLTLERLRVKDARDSFFAKGDRAALFFPRDFQSRFEDDEVYEGRQKLSLIFELPRGSYATILARRLGLR